MEDNTTPDAMMDTAECNSVSSSLSNMKQRLFTDSVIQWLALSDLRLCRHGYSQTDITLLTPIHYLVKEGNLLRECAEFQLYILGDISTVTIRRKMPTWMVMHSALAPILDHLPDKVPQGHTPLDVGQSGN